MSRKGIAVKVKETPAHVIEVRTGTQGKKRIKVTEGRMVKKVVVVTAV